MKTLLSSQLDAGHYAWLDLETDGLNPNAPNASILEVAVIITTGEFEPVDSFHSFVQPNSDQSTWDGYVRSMHEGSGLLAEMLEQPSLPTAAEVDELLCNYLRAQSCYGVATPAGSPWKSPLCGNSIQFDRGWMQVLMPKSIGKLNRRNLDVSSWVYPMQDLGLPNMLKTSGPKHRAMDDITYSLQAFKACFHAIQSAPFKLSELGGRVLR